MQSIIDLTANIPRSFLDTYLALYIENIINDENSKANSEEKGDKKYEDI